jgi:putative tricarboxylic transport membrane protein
MRFFPLMLKIPYAYLYSVIIIMCVVGAYVSTNTAFNILLTLCLAIVSLIIDIAGIAISPLILGFILGPMLESNFRKGMSYSADGFITFLTRPVSAILLLLAIFTLVWPILKPKLKRS